MGNRLVIIATITRPLLLPRPFVTMDSFMARWRVRQSLSAFTYGDYAKKYNAAVLIQRRWKMCISNPSYKMCKDRLVRECNDMKTTIVTYNKCRFQNVNY